MLFTVWTTLPCDLQSDAGRLCAVQEVWTNILKLLCILGAVNHIKERKRHRQCRKSCRHRQVGWQWLSSSPPSTYPTFVLFDFSCSASSITLSPSLFLVSLHSLSLFVLSFVLSISPPPLSSHVSHIALFNPTPVLLFLTPLYFLICASRFSPPYLSPTRPLLFLSYNFRLFKSFFKDFLRVSLFCFRFFFCLPTFLPFFPHL